MGSEWLKSKFAATREAQLGMVRDMGIRIDDPEIRHLVLPSFRVGPDPKPDPPIGVLPRSVERRAIVASARRGDAPPLSKEPAATTAPAVPGRPLVSRA
jgi:hypothetical protein